MTTPTADVAYNDYVGIPFVEKGREPETDGGVDCWGLIRVLHHERTGEWLPSWGGEYESTKTRPVLGSVIERFRDEWFTRVKTPREGDLVLMRIGPNPVHIGMTVDPPRFIHCMRGAMSAIDRWDAMRWTNRLVGFWRRSP